MHQESSDTNIGGETRGPANGRGKRTLQRKSKIFEEIDDQESFNQYIFGLINRQMSNKRSQFEQREKELENKLKEQERLIKEQNEKLKRNENRGGGRTKTKSDKSKQGGEIGSENFTPRPNLCKSPSDTTLYTPALKQAFDGKSGSARIIKQITSLKNAKKKEGREPRITGNVTVMLMTYKLILMMNHSVIQTLKKSKIQYPNKLLTRPYLIVM